MTPPTKRIRKKLNGAVFVIGERRLDRIKLTSYLNTKPRREQISVVVIADEVPIGAYDALAFIHERVWSCAWPAPPSHRVAELFRDCARELCI
jgi:hypothetical protein